MNPIRVALSLTALAASIPASAVAAPSQPLSLRAHCYNAMSTSPRLQGLTFGEFLDRGKQRGAFKNVLITGKGGRYTVRMRLGQLAPGQVKIATLNYESGPSTPACKGRPMAVLTRAAINLERLNAGNTYVFAAMLNAMVYGDMAE